MTPIKIDIGEIGKIADELITSDEERMRFMQRANEMQGEVNKLEAQHSSLFIAGWRPFIGWVCGLAMALQFMVIPITNYIFIAVGLELDKIPPLNWQELTPVLLGMLGLGGLRTYEKVKKVSRRLIKRKDR